MKRIGREAVEVNISAPQEGHVPIYDAQNRLWNTISTSSFLSDSSSFATTASYALTSSFSQNAVSSSYATFATTSSFANDFTVTGTLTAQTIIVQVITSSTELVTGSLTVSGSLNALGGVTGSLLGTASWARNAITSSFAQSGNGNFTGSFTGSFFGDGSGITNISASSVVGLNLSAITSGSVTASVDPTYGFRVNSNSQISGSTQITGSLGVTGSVSILGNIGNVLSANIDTISFTGSFFQSGSMSVTNGVTASLYGTASWALNSISSSYALTASFVPGAIYDNQTSSLTVLSSSFASTASYAFNAISASYALTSSYAFNAISASYAATASSADDFLVRGTLTAQTIVAQTITSSVEFVTGSTRFGSLLSNTHEFTGSVSMTGSLSAINAIITGSLYGTSSWSKYSTTASYALDSDLLDGKDSSTFATTGSNTFYGDQIISGSSVSVLDLHGINDGLWWFRLFNDTYNLNQSVFAGWVGNDGTAYIGNEVDTPIYIYTNAQYGTPILLISSSGVTVGSGGITGSLYGTASWAENAITASYALNSISASHADNSTTASYSLNATSASYAISSSQADNANTASYVLSAVSASYAQTSSYAVRFNVSQSFTASGLRYPTVDNGNESFIQTDGAGNLSLQYVKSMYEPVRNREAFSITSGTPLFVSGATGANSDVYVADASNPARMPATYMASETIAPSATGKALISGLLTNFNTTAYQAGQGIFVAAGSGITTTRPAYPNSVQLLGIITRVGVNGQAVILNPGQIEIQNIQPGYVLVGNNVGTPTAVATSSLSVATASFVTASGVYGPYGASSVLSASYAQTASYAKDITISGSITGIDYIDFDTSYAFVNVPGRLGWDSAENTLQLGLAGGNVQYSMGEQIYQYVYNAEPTSLTKGQVVYVSGSQGNKIAVKLAANNSDRDSASTLGLVAETIASGGDGWIITEGTLRKLNTLGLQAGKLLFLGSTPGTYTQTPPTAPSHSVRLGYVERVSATVGSIYVKIDNGYEIGELHDVIDTTTTSSYGDLFIKSGSVWHNSRQLTGSYGLTGSLTATAGGFTGSLYGTASWATQAITASYADYFTVKNNAVVSGSLTILQNLTVFGSASITYITESTLDISTNLIRVNTNTPSIRFGGLAVIDSGSSPRVSGSWLFDSDQDRWIMVHQQIAGSVLTSSLAIMGPETYGNIGNETQLTLNRLTKAYPGSSGEHIGDSQVSDDGTTVSIPGNLVVTSGITGSLFGTASWANNAISSSYALSASQALTSSFVNPLNQSVTISNNLTVTGSFYLSSSLHAVVKGVAPAGLSTALIVLPTGSFSAAFFDYTISSGSNARAGTITAVWNGDEVRSHDNSTVDIGNTSLVTVYVGEGGGNIDFTVFPNVGDWNVKAIYRLI